MGLRVIAPPYFLFPFEIPAITKQVRNLKSNVWRGKIIPTLWKWTLFYEGKVVFLLIINHHTWRYWSVTNNIFVRNAKKNLTEFKWNLNKTFAFSRRGKALSQDKTVKCWNLNHSFFPKKTLVWKMESF